MHRGKDCFLQPLFSVTAQKEGVFEMKFRLNSMEKKWILYDVGNSAFTLLVSTIMPIYLITWPIRLGFLK